MYYHCWGFAWHVLDPLVKNERESGAMQRTADKQALAPEAVKGILEIQILYVTAYCIH